MRPGTVEPARHRCSAAARDVRVAAMMWIVLLTSTPQAAPSQEIEPVSSERLVVLPLTNATGQPDGAEASSGLQALLLAHLSQHQQVVVVEREQLEEVLRERGLSLQGYAQDAATWQHIGRLYNANRLVSGSFMLVNKQWNIRAHVFDIETTALIASQEVSGPAEDLGRLTQELAARIVGSLLINAARREERPVDAEPERNLRFLYGLGYASVNLHDQAIAEFMQALDLKPDDPDARWWLARSYLAAGEADHARIELERFTADFPRHPLGRQLEALLSGPDPEDAEAAPEPLTEGERDAP